MSGLGSVPSADGVVVRVPAKINLALAVGDVRADGYHELATVFHAVDLYDEVTIRPSGSWSVRAGGVPGVPTTRSNLALKAAMALHAHLVRRGRRPGEVSIEIDKKIPVAGGMAGGSADAAAALVGCAALWDAELSRDDLIGIAAGIGSDVPFALTGGTALGTGRGEVVSPVLTRMTLTWVLAMAGSGLSTPEVFAECDRLRAGVDDSALTVPRADADAMVAALRSGDVDEVGAALANDLQPAAFSLYPKLRRTVRAGVDAGAVAGIVSGSGPTVALLCRDLPQASDVAAAMSSSGTCEGVRVASGPAHGARLIGGSLR